METLQRLTRRQIEVLRTLQESGGRAWGLPLKEVAQRLGISSPSALGHLTSLEDLGLVVRHRGKSGLTDRGRLVLLEYERHHRIAEGLFTRLGFSSRDSCRAAREVDLVLSHRTVERICDAAGHPAYCPHGRPIPPCRKRSS